MKYRDDMISQKRAELAIFQREAQQYQVETLTKYGLDPQIAYNIDDRGVVTEVEQSPMQGAEPPKMTPEQQAQFDKLAKEKEAQEQQKSKKVTPIKKEPDK